MPPISRIEIYRDADGNFRWRLRVPNGEIVVVSEAYASKGGCRKAIKFVKANIPKAELVDMAYV